MPANLILWSHLTSDPPSPVWWCAARSGLSEAANPPPICSICRGVWHAAQVLVGHQELRGLPLSDGPMAEKTSPQPILETTKDWAQSEKKKKQVSFIGHSGWLQTELRYFSTSCQWSSVLFWISVFDWRHRLLQLRVIALEDPSRPPRSWIKVGWHGWLVPTSYFPVLQQQRYYQYLLHSGVETVWQMDFHKTVNTFYLPKLTRNRSSSGFCFPQNPVQIWLQDRRHAYDTGPPQWPPS